MKRRQLIIPPRLQAGDVIGVIAPASSRRFVMEYDNTRWITERFALLGLELTFGNHVDEDDVFRSSSIASRVSDLHSAFSNPQVRGILTVIGGLTSNELLPYLDWDLIANNPKILCGYSDITALNNAIFAKTGLVTYSGPHWSTFGMRDYFEPTGEWFRRTLFNNYENNPITLEPSKQWTDDLWFQNQDERHPEPNEGWWVLQEGSAAGTIIGGNLATFSLLQGTPFLPKIEGALLFIEDIGFYPAPVILRKLASLLQMPGAEALAGLVIGRFQRHSGISRDVLEQIISRQPALRGKPVVANLDFGHTNPLITYPIGGEATVSAEADRAQIVITRY